MKDGPVVKARRDLGEGKPGRPGTTLARWL